MKFASIYALLQHIIFNLLLPPICVHALSITHHEVSFEEATSLGQTVPNLKITTKLKTVDHSFFKHATYLGLARTVYGISVYVYIRRINRI
jgi:hypothetical protein